MKTIFECSTHKIEYTLGQHEALTKVDNFLKSKDNFFLLAGYSGCGKTTIAENIANFSKAMLTAPTNAAVNRLREKISNPSLEYNTIHSLLYVPTEKPGVFEKTKGFKPNKTYIVDECSMIDEYLLEDLIAEGLKNNSKVIFMGDSFQLEPIGKDPKIFSWEKVRPDVFFEGNRCELTEVKRYDGDLLNIATEMRTTGEPEFNKIESDDLLILDKFSKELIKDIKSNASYIVLTSTNDKRLKYNEAIRAIRYKTVEDLSYAQRGDKLVSVSNSNNYSNGETFELNDALLIGEFRFSIRESNEEYTNVQAFLYKENEELIFLLPHLKAPSFHGAEFVKIYKDGLATIPYNLKKLILVDIPKKHMLFWNKKVTIATYGYAVSCHKAQGQEWDNVYIDAQWLMPIWNKARWFYTAITRAKVKVQVAANKYLKEIK